MAMDLSAEQLAKTCFSGADLRRFVEEVLVPMAVTRDRTGSPITLDVYLYSVWQISRRYLGEPFRFSWIAEILLRAFEPLASVNTADRRSLDLPYCPALDALSSPGTPEFDREIRTYDYFERVLRRQILERQYLQSGLHLPPGSRWENGSVATYLERGTAGLDENTEVEVGASWGYFAGILADGQYIE